MLRIGILGVGSIAGAHVSALQHLPQAQVTALVDPVLERAERAAAAVGGRPFASVEQCWDRVDAVWICAPHHLHAELAIAAAAAGKHVFVEKPIAHSLEAADAMIAACHRAQVTLMVGQTLRFQPPLRALHRLVQAGELGYLTACWSWRWSGADVARMAWWRQDWRVGGGFTIQMGSHELDFVRWVAAAAGGSPEAVSGVVRCTRPEYPYLDTYVRATVRFSNGAVGGLDGGYGAPPGGSVCRAVAGQRGMAVAEGDRLRVRLLGEREDRRVTVPRADEVPGTTAGILAEDEAFLRAIAEGRPPAVPGEDSRETLALCLAVHRAAREGVPVTL